MVTTPFSGSVFPMPINQLYLTTQAISSPFPLRPSLSNLEDLRWLLSRCFQNRSWWNPKVDRELGCFTKLSKGLEFHRTMERMWYKCLKYWPLKTTSPFQTQMKSPTNFQPVSKREGRKCPLTFARICSILGSTLLAKRFRHLTSTM